MSLEQRTYSVLLISSSAKFSGELKERLPSSDFFPVHSVKSIAAAGRSFSAREYDFVIINSPLTDDSGIDFAIDVGSSENAVALLIVQNEIHEEVFLRVRSQGVFTLAKPFSEQTLSAAFRWMSVVKERLRKSEQKAQTVEAKMEEIRLVNRAKWVLIRELQMDEPQAHRYIEKQAMDRSVSKREVAEMLIRTYSN